MKNLWKAYLFTLILLFLCLAPSNTFPEVGIINFDKFVHLFIYYIQAFLYIAAFYRIDPDNKFKYLFIPVIINLCIGGLTEILQSLIVIINRKGDWIDFIFNSTGILLAVITYKPLAKSKLNFIIRRL